MIQRCQNPKCLAFEHYGERGIKVCNRWRDFSNFLEDMGERPGGTTLDRVDVNGDYEPENCRWATPKEQMRNRRITRYAIYRGKRVAVSELSEWLSVPRRALAYRVRNWPEERWAEPLQLEKSHRR